MVTAILKDGENEISHLEKSVIMASSRASGKGRLKHLHDSSDSPLSPCCQPVSSGRQIKLPLMWTPTWKSEGDHSKAGESMTQDFPSKFTLELSFLSPNHIWNSASVLPFLGDHGVYLF